MWFVSVRFVVWCLVWIDCRVARVVCCVAACVVGWFARFCGARGACRCAVLLVCIVCV